MLFCATFVFPNNSRRLSAALQLEDLMIQTKIPVPDDVWVQEEYVKNIWGDNDD